MDSHQKGREMMVVLYGWPPCEVLRRQLGISTSVRGATCFRPGDGEFQWYKSLYLILAFLVQSLRCWLCHGRFSQALHDIQVQFVNSGVMNASRL